ncbi:MAG: proline--tRNA ligase [Candidatus Heimdallarchaeota archaeon]|nr:proline--tRNA ligase [Candidatus Heimdallarchaeota archaeon]
MVNVFRTKIKTQKVSDSNNRLFDKENNFWQWFIWILKEARIIDTDYSVKGCYVWMDWGYKLYNNIYIIAQEAYAQSGHKQMHFPSLIKEETFMKETEFIRNFEDDVFWIDREGQKKLHKGERLALRPTSELIIYPMFSKWIRSWRDLPMKIFQNVSIFRCETNDTRPLIRNRETIGFIEGHSAFGTEEEALENLKLIWKIYRELCSNLGIPVKLVEVPSWDRFAGSGKTIDGYVLLPGSKSMELFTTAYLGTTFSKIFDIKYLDKKKDYQFAHLLCYGPSIDRILATLISLYGDNRGLILLPEITPIEIIITPIFTKENKDTILLYANQVKNHLLKDGFSVLLDDNEDTTPGAKFYHAERLGFPLRIELGKSEFDTKMITITSRDNLKKEKIPLNDTDRAKKIKSILKRISTTLRRKARQYFHSHIKDISHEILDSYLRSNTLISDIMYQICWCGSKACSKLIEEKTFFSILGFDINLEEKEALCTICQKKGRIAILAKKY